MNLPYALRHGFQGTIEATTIGLPCLVSYEANPEGLVTLASACINGDIPPLRERERLLALCEADAKLVIAEHNR